MGRQFTFIVGIEGMDKDVLRLGGGIDGLRELLHATLDLLIKLNSGEAGEIVLRGEGNVLELPETKLS